MLVSTELLGALQAAGVDREKAEAAAAVLAEHQRRLNALEHALRNTLWIARGVVLMLLAVFIVSLWMLPALPH